jgi:hypothetical protein
MTKPLTARRLRTLLDYCPETGLFTWKVRASNRTKIGAVAGSGHRDGYTSVRIDGVDHFAHRLAFFWTIGRWPAGRVGHINGDRKDNRWLNLKQARSPRRTKNGFSNNPFPQRDDSPPGQAAAAE